MGTAEQPGEQNKTKLSIQLHEIITSQSSIINTTEYFTSPHENFKFENPR